MKTHTKTRRGTITSSILALTLAFGLMPAQGMAFAAEAAAQAEQDAAVAQDVSSDVALADAETPAEPEAADATASTEAPTADPAADAAADPAARQPQYTTSTEGHTAAVLPLQTEATPAAGAIEYGGLAYTIDPENPDTALLTGLATDKPKGDVQVQTQVASNGKVYQVTSIQIVTGGGFTAKPERR